MSGALAAREAVYAAFVGDATLVGLVNQIADGVPVEASAPWLKVGDPVASGWGARGVDGLMLRQPIELVVRGDDLTSVTAILDRVEAVLGAMPGDLGDWKITSLNFASSRIMRSRTDWRSTITYALRLARLG